MQKINHDIVLITGVADFFIYEFGSFCVRSDSYFYM